MNILRRKVETQTWQRLKKKYTEKIFEEGIFSNKFRQANPKSGVCNISYDINQCFLTFFCLIHGTLEPRVYTFEAHLSFDDQKKAKKKKSILFIIYLYNIK